MITVEKTPSYVALSENPVVIRLKTDNSATVTGTKARLVLYFGSVIYTGSGYQFSITFGGNTYTFTMADVPDNSGLQFPKAATGDNNLSWMAKIKDALYQNYYISEKYDLSYTYNQVWLTAKETGSTYDITGQNISVSGMSVAAYAATDGQTREFFKL